MAIFKGNLSKNLVTLVVALVTVVTIVTGQNSTSNGDTEGINFCTERESCECEQIHITPLPIRCEGMGLVELYEQADFLATFDYLNITTNTTLALRFDENKIEYIPRFAPMPIVTLTFRHNSIVGIEKQAFAELKQLQILDLSHNNLTSESLNENVLSGGWNASLGYFPLTVTHLNLSYNRIHSLDKNAFDHLTRN